VSDAVCILCHEVERGPAAAADAPGIADAHAKVACVQCHSALASFDPAEGEHATPVEPASCTSCHADAAHGLGNGAHSKAGVSCKDCHGSHRIQGFHEADQALSFVRLSALCLRCHSQIADASEGDIHAHAFSGRSCLACHDAHDARRPALEEGDRLCMVCHAADAAGEADAPEPASAVAASVHGAAGVTCVLCHADLQDEDALPHDEVAPVRCESCHPEEGAAHARGVHHSDEADAEPAASCQDCHGTHGVRAASDPSSPVYASNQPQTCGQCHRSDGSAPASSAGEAVAIYEKSVHGRLLLEKGLIVSATCSSCHGSHEVRATEDPQASVARRSTPYTCGTCHAGMLSSYLAGVHGADFLEGGADVPVCTDCHSEHAIDGGDREGSTVSAAQVASTCSRCHADDELVQRHGLKATALASWGSSYHGIASGFGEARAANCASCHGFHDIFPSSDPRSRVHPANLDRTCGTCHEGAGAAFAKVPVHSVIDRETNFVPWLVRTVYAWLVGGVIGAFLAFILIDLFGRLRLRLGWGPAESEHVDPRLWPDEDALVAPAETFRRMGRQARLQHGVLIASFLLLVLTGLPVFLHESGWMRSVIDLEGGFRLRSILHRVGAVALIGLSVWHVACLALQPSARRWFASMLFRPRDVTDFLRELMFDLGWLDWLARRRPFTAFFARHPALRCAQRPLAGRYGLVEKLEYGAVLWGNLVMIATGLILWRPDWFLDWTPAWTFDVCRVVHGFEATLAFLAIVIWHMYHVHLRPGVFPMSRTWLTGRISRAELRHHHPEEYLGILRSRRALSASRSDAKLPPAAGG
jgi:predicted CXXCH cytochrome family protein